MQTRNRRYRRSGGPLTEPRPVRGQTVQSQLLAVSQEWLKKDGWALSGIVLMLIFALWYFGWYSGTFAIQQVTVEGNQFATTEEVQQSVYNYMDSTALAVIPRDTYWSMRTVGLEKHIQDTIGVEYAIASVQVKKDFPHGVSIVLEERVPSITWVARGTGGIDRYYTVDRSGIVTQEVASWDEVVAQQYPYIIDVNRDYFEIGWNIVSPEYVGAMLWLREEIPASYGWSVREYFFPAVECSDRQYIAEQIFDSQEPDESDEFVERKREIQEQFQSGVLTVDQSLELLDQIRRDELSEQGKDPEESPYSRYQWTPVNNPRECDYVNIAQDMHVRIDDRGDELLIYVDTSKDLTQQLIRVHDVLYTRVDETIDLEYVDVRISDRVYYK